MADLSSLSDEQLGVYREMLAKKNQSPTSTQDTSESPMQYAKNTIRNVPSSLANTAKQMAFGPQIAAVNNLKISTPSLRMNVTMRYRRHGKRLSIIFLTTNPASYLVSLQLVTGPTRRL